MSAEQREAEEAVGKRFGFTKKHGTWYYREQPFAALSVAPQSNMTTVGDKLCLLRWMKSSAPIPPAERDKEVERLKGLLTGDDEKTAR